MQLARENKTEVMEGMKAEQEVKDEEEEHREEKLTFAVIIMEEKMMTNKN
jgi:hypothetical protein